MSSSRHLARHLLQFGHVKGEIERNLDRHDRIALVVVNGDVGAVLLTLSVIALLMGLSELGTTLGSGLLVVALLLIALLLWVESRAADPVLPLSLLKDRLFAVACAHGLFSGWSMFGSLSFVPLFAHPAGYCHTDTAHAEPGTR